MADNQIERSQRSLELQIENSEIATDAGSVPSRRTGRSRPRKRPFPKVIKGQQELSSQNPEPPRSPGGDIEELHRDVRQGAHQVVGEEVVTGDADDIKDRNTDGESVEVPPSTIDVMENRQVIIDAGKEIVKAQVQGNLDKAKQIFEEKLLPLWGRFKLEDMRVDNLHHGSGMVRNRRITAPFAFANTEDFKVINSALLEGHALKYSKQAELDTTIAFSDEALAGVQRGMERVGNDYETLGCEKPRINNSVLFGRDILKYAKDGIIKDSIIGGFGALTNSLGMRLINCYVITPNGMYFFDDVGMSQRFRFDERYRRTSY